ncbi:MAG: AraC family transcriptional regulator ligand-binding domain-containing protein [Pseudomonadota bacterium]
MAGYTRASALGPISDFVQARGGSIDRVFREVDLPLSLLDDPDLPLPLREQFKVLSEAGREIGDAYFGAALGRVVSMQKLSAFGAWVSGAPTLASGIDRSQRGLNRFLQTATDLEFRVIGSQARWSIRFTDPGADGRFQNELLGVSYLIDGVRHFARRAWSPTLIRSTCVGAKQAADLERIFEAPVLHDQPESSIDFDAALLVEKRSRVVRSVLEAEPPIPPPKSYRDDVAALSTIALLEGQPKIDWVAKKLDLSRRSLQRVLEAEGCSFSDVLEGLLKDRAVALLRTTELSLTEIALKLGYSDSAHFSRAFKRWTRVSPHHFRSRGVDTNEAMPLAHRANKTAPGLLLQSSG